MKRIVGIWPTPPRYAITGAEQRPFAPDGTATDPGIAAPIAAGAEQIIAFDRMVRA